MYKVWELIVNVSQTKITKRRNQTTTSVRTETNRPINSNDRRLSSENFLYIQSSNSALEFKVRDRRNIFTALNKPHPATLYDSTKH